MASTVLAVLRCPLRTRSWRPRVHGSVVGALLGADLLLEAVSRFADTSRQARRRDRHGVPPGGHVDLAQAIVGQFQRGSSLMAAWNSTTASS